LSTSEERLKPRLRVLHCPFTIGSPFSSQQPNCSAAYLIKAGPRV
jgi:hypothetical protein